MQDFRGTAKEAIEIQKRMKGEVSLGPLEKPIRTIAGADVSLERFGTDLYAGIVVLSYPDLQVVSYAVAKAKVTFPYVPGLLSFREIPGLLLCLEKLKIRPDLIMVDGQGIAHPRRLGIASHLGVLAKIPTIGCAKSRLYGKHDEPDEAGEARELRDPHTDELLGYALRSKERSNPLIVSPGYGISAKESLDVVKSCLRGYRLPEPTRLAHELVNKFRRGEIDSSSRT
jgi:deoxyribonuclease V